MLVQRKDMFHLHKVDLDTMDDIRVEKYEKAVKQRIKRTE